MNDEINRDEIVLMTQPETTAKPPEYPKTNIRYEPWDLFIKHITPLPPKEALKLALETLEKSRCVYPVPCVLEETIRRVKQTLDSME